VTKPIGIGGFEMEAVECVESSFMFNYKGVNYKLCERIFPTKWLCEKAVFPINKQGEEYLSDNYQYIEVFEFGNELWCKHKEARKA